MNTVMNARRRGVATHVRDAVYNEITSRKLVVDRCNSVSCVLRYGSDESADLDLFQRKRAPTAIICR